MDKNQLNSPNKYFHNRQGKVKYFQGQMKKVFTAFYSQPKTMLMVSVETGILRANICRSLQEGYLPPNKMPCRVLHHQPRNVPKGLQKPKKQNGMKLNPTFESLSPETITSHVEKLVKLLRKTKLCPTAKYLYS